MKNITIISGVGLVVSTAVAAVTSIPASAQAQTSVSRETAAEVRQNVKRLIQTYPGDISKITPKDIEQYGYFNIGKNPHGVNLKDTTLNQYGISLNPQYRQGCNQSGAPFTVFSKTADKPFATIDLDPRAPNYDIGVDPLIENFCVQLKREINANQGVNHNKTITPIPQTRPPTPQLW